MNLYALCYLSVGMFAMMLIDRFSIKKEGSSIFNRLFEEAEEEFGGSFNNFDELIVVALVGLFWPFYAVCFAIATVKNVFKKIERRKK